jgi:regulator of cell morphogenesis and NO signaling
MQSPIQINEPTVAELVVQNFNRARIFERFGIDYCCGGKVSLAEACAKAGAPLPAVVNALADSESSSTETTDDYQQWSNARLAAHIVDTHHAYLRTEIPRIMALFEHVCMKHGEQFPELLEAQAVFVRMSAELLNHMQHEENSLFPLCLDPARTEWPTWIVDALEHDHTGTGNDLARLRTLLYNYEPRPDLCRKRLALLHALEQFERDMHQHVHLENNILFPRLRG